MDIIEHEIVLYHTQTYLETRLKTETEAYGQTANRDSNLTSLIPICKETAFITWIGFLFKDSYRKS